MFKLDLEKAEEPEIKLPTFVVIHTVKGFSVVNEAEVDGFSGTPLLSP